MVVCSALLCFVSSARAGNGGEARHLTRQGHLLYDLTSHSLRVPQPAFIERPRPLCIRGAAGMSSFCD